MSKGKANVYTRTGDGGTTGLFGGSRVDKESGRVEAYGTLDELGASLSLAKTLGVDPDVRAVLDRLDTTLYQMGAEIASDEKGVLRLKHIISERDVTTLEERIDEFDAKLSKLTEFIVPVEEPGAAALNVSRTVCRRAERRLWTLSRTEKVNPHLITFVNRLSDLLFTLMRFEGRDRPTRVAKKDE
ncbi:MAG: cob(I)yrinic acid a,c-diamide adenosyltransferase [Planctomycetes bacterium]|nr:cob(I)yrinic acid a,c-diamide adenosyltransferase [Planctomycetota bacterium]